MTPIPFIPPARKRLLQAILLSLCLFFSAFGIAAEPPAQPASTTPATSASGIDSLEKPITGPAEPSAVTPSANRFDSPLIFLVLLAASLARALFGMAGSIGIALLAAALVWFSFASVTAALAMGAFAFLISLIRFSPGSGNKKNNDDGARSSGDARSGKW